MKKRLRDLVRAAWLQLSPEERQCATLPVRRQIKASCCSFFWKDYVVAVYIDGLQVWRTPTVPFAFIQTTGEEQNAELALEALEAIESDIAAYVNETRELADNHQWFGWGVLTPRGLKWIWRDE
jgi:hypothetical protein